MDLMDLSSSMTNSTFSSMGTSTVFSLALYSSLIVTALAGTILNCIFALAVATFAMFAADSAAAVTEPLVRPLVAANPQAPPVNALIPQPDSLSEVRVFVLPSMAMTFVPVEDSILTSANSAPILSARLIAACARSSIRTPGGNTGNACHSFKLAQESRGLEPGSALGRLDENTR